MSTSAQQLQTDFEQVTQLLALYPQIRLLQTEGDPPDRYDIEYNVKGYKANPDGTASPADNHLVRFTLPFGYPHFAPSVKPLSPIFHPDIDPDAVRIADFWEKNKSLPELIVHIGQMICGALYSSEEPFNQRALDWYEEHRSQLPFAILAPRENGAPDEAEAGVPELPSIPEETNLPAGADPAEGSQARAAEEAGEEFPLEQPDNGFTLDLELENKGYDAAGTDMELEDWTAFQENDGLPGDADHEISSDTTRAENPSGKPTGENENTGETEDLFNFEFEAAPDHSATEEREEGVDSLEWDITEPFNIEEEKGQSAAAEKQPDNSDGDIAGDIALEPEAESSLPAEKVQPADSDEAVLEEKGLETFALKLDEDPSRRYGGQERSIRPLIEKKEIFTAKKVLSDLADPETVPDIEEFRLTISAAINEAEELYKKADKHEQNGELEKAGIILDLVANIAIDYPGLEFARNRIRESLMAQGQKKPPPAPMKDNEAKGRDKEEKTPAEVPSPAGKVRPPIGMKLPYKLIAVTLVLAGSAIGGFLLFSRDTNNIRLAQHEFDTGRQHLQQKDFKPARRAFDAARTALDNVLIVHRGTRRELQAQIDGIVNSLAFKEGLQGRVLYDGRYVTVETAKAIDQFKLHTDAAEKFLQAGRLDRAVESYEKSLPYIEPAGFLDQELNIRQTINTLRLRQLLTRAKEEEEAGDWGKAADTYTKALEFGSSFTTPEERQQIGLQLAAASYRHELDEGRQAHASSDWEKARDRLTRAETILADNPTIATDEEKTELRKLLVNSRLFHLLSVARKAFEEQQWDQAVTYYAQAVALLDESGDILDREKAADSKRKIEKTILMTRIAREQNRIEAAMENNALEQALGHYRAIVGLIDASPFQHDETVLRIHENARSRSAAVEKELSISRRIDWLTQNFDRIFREHYPSAKLSELSHPKVSFIKREGNIMIFAMSCSEKHQGRTFRLELNYQYDVDSDSWQIYSGKL